MTDERTVKYYDLNAKKYAEETNNADMYEAYSHFIKHIPNNGRIIDIGCGGGRDLKYFSDVGYQAEGLDVSEPLCLIASNYSNCKVYCSDLLSWKPDYCYDAIWANASLLHLSEEEILKFFETKNNTLKIPVLYFFP